MRPKICKCERACIAKWLFPRSSEVKLAVEHAKIVNFFRYEILEVCSYVRCLYHNAYLGYVDFLGFSGNIGPNLR